MGMETGGLIGLLILAADIWALVNVVQSGVSTGTKVLWILLVVLLPLFGFIIWLIVGPRGGAATTPRP